MEAFLCLVRNWKMPYIQNKSQSFFSILLINSYGNTGLRNTWSQQFFNQFCCFSSTVLLMIWYFNKNVIGLIIPGHSFISQFSVLIGCPIQGFPPKADCCNSNLSCDLVPVPHFTEQDVHSFHADHVQSTMLLQKYRHQISKWENPENVRTNNNIPGQSLILQLSIFWGCPSQDFPLLAASCFTDLSWYIEPSPHVSEQDDHSLHADQTQSTMK